MRLRAGVAAGVVGSCSSDLTPSLGNSICHRCSPKKIKKKGWWWWGGETYISENGIGDKIFFSLVPLPTTKNENPEETKVCFILTIIRLASIAGFTLCVKCFP